MQPSLSKKIVGVLVGGLFGVSAQVQTMESAWAQTKGMTWEKESVDTTYGIVRVGCGYTAGKGGSECNPYTGDTVCTAQLPVLCFLDLGLPKPPQLPNGSTGRPEWSGGVVATTEPVAGNTFATIMDVNEFCRTTFGPDWRVAEHHDAWGWYLRAYGNIGSNYQDTWTRFWVDINDQPNGNCWQ
jgi:hypothetical protein